MTPGGFLAFALYIGLYLLRHFGFQFSLSCFFCFSSSSVNWIEILQFPPRSFQLRHTGILWPAIFRPNWHRFDPLRALFWFFPPSLFSFYFFIYLFSSFSCYFGLHTLLHFSDFPRHLLICDTRTVRYFINYIHYWG